jgi:hypothetical protein
MAGAIIAITEVERNRNFHSAAFIKTNEHPRSFECSASRRPIVRSQFSICALFPASPLAILVVPSTALLFRQEWHATKESGERERRRTDLIGYRSRLRIAVFFWLFCVAFRARLHPPSHCPIVRITRFIPWIPRESAFSHAFFFRSRVKWSIFRTDDGQTIRFSRTEIPSATNTRSFFWLYQVASDRLRAFEAR